MPKPRLHLDADTSSKSLYDALLERDHDVTRTPNEWMTLNADDETQLRGATAQRRVLFTFNIRDFIKLTEHYPDHAGLILAAQKSWSLSALIVALDRVLTETNA